jgi:phosphoenolpyruvate mutase
METNYIYSIYLARNELKNEDILLMHGDLVFENSVLESVISSKESCMVVSSTNSLPKKDFKAVIQEGKVTKVGIEFFNNAMAAQALYNIKKEDWKIWSNEIIKYCESGNCSVYAECAFNDVSEKCRIVPIDVKDGLCSEIDDPNDLAVVMEKVKNLEKKTVYMCFSTDMVHSGHIALIKKASRLGKLIIGVLSDEAVVSYKRFPLLPFKERKALFSNIAGVYKVIEQKQLSYRENLEKLHPDYVVHGDDWKTGVQKPIRDEVNAVLATYGGVLVEYPYASDKRYKDLEDRARAELSLPDVRRSRLKKAIQMKGLVRAIETHSGITGLIAEKTVVNDDEGKSYQFDAMWVSSLCDSTAKGKPDIELVDMTSRFRTIDDIMEVTTKPVIFDGDTGGMIEHFVYTVKTLERMGVSMVIIEDKTGLKKNSLFGTEVKQTQDSIENFSAKIRAGKNAQKSNDFMIVARIESLILERGMDDALERAFAFTEAGADGIMIHSRKKEPDEIFEFVEKFRAKDAITPIVVVPTSFNQVTEDEFKRRGVNVVIYANHLTRSGFPAMRRTAETILLNHRAKEADAMCMPIKEILTLIPEDY